MGDDRVKPSPCRKLRPGVVARSAQGASGGRPGWSNAAGQSADMESRPRSSGRSCELSFHQDGSPLANGAYGPHGAPVGRLRRHRRDVQPH